MEKDSLASKEQWEEVWSSASIQSLPFDPLHRRFRDIHSLCTRTLPKVKGTRLLEIGCYPGRYLWYFAKYFNCQVSGIEYIGSCCRECRRLLAESGVAGDCEIIHADIFDYKGPKTKGGLWDVVASFGLLEHFKGQAAVSVLEKHLELLKPGGFLVLSVPNFQGIYGLILKNTSPTLYRIHRVMSLEVVLRELHDAASAQGVEIEIVEGGYYGRLGLNHVGILELAGKLHPVVFQATRDLQAP